MNLLINNLLRVQTAKRLTWMNLPALLAALGRDEVDSLPGLQRHQEDAFHVFLCYLAASVLARQGDNDPLQSEDYWRDGLRALAEGNDDAWSLVVEDLSQPAFMQPPLPKSDHGRLKLQAETPDELDLLPTAKNHDLKQARAFLPELDEWIYALVSLQTMSGYFGRGNPGISRMNSGFGNRPVVEIVHNRRIGHRWRDAVQRLFPHRTETLASPWGYDPTGLVLVWLREWDGKTGLDLKTLDPFYLEICRRVRLGYLNEDTIYGMCITTDQPRIAAKELKGHVGDAWLPIDLANKKGEAALTVGPTGITSELLRRILFHDSLKLTELHQPIPERPGDVWLLVSVLVRGQGTTDGFCEKWIPIPHTFRRRLFGPPERRQPLAALAKTAIEFAGQMQNRVLKPAVFAYLEGSPEKIQFDRDSAQDWWEKSQRRFNTLWSDDYFPWLWSVPEDFDEDSAHREWIERLRDHAFDVLNETREAMPAHSGRRWRSRTQAEGRFWGALYHHFPQLKENRHDTAAGL
ncbi:MAG: hypothetical protein Kow0060_03240 [Methylohalobius crimeensis]